VGLLWRRAQQTLPAPPARGEWGSAVASSLAGPSARLSSQLGGPWIETEPRAGRVGGARGLTALLVAAAAAALLCAAAATVALLPGAALLLLLWHAGGRRGEAAGRATTSRGGRCDQGSVGGDGGSVREAELLQSELVEGRGEGHAGRAGDEVAGGAEFGVGATQEVEDEGALCDLFPCIAKAISSLLDLLAVIFNREVALVDVVEFMAEVDAARSPVRREVGIDGDPELARRLIRCHGEV